MQELILKMSGGNLGAIQILASLYRQEKMAQDQCMKINLSKCQWKEIKAKVLE